MFDEQHQFLGSFGMFTDITDRKQAEEALRLSSERLQLATRAARIGIWDWDIPRNELVWDESMYHLYGLRSGDFGEAYDAWIRTVHPEDKARTDGEIQAALRGEREYAPEFRIVRADGSIRYIKADSRTIRDPEGKPLRMIGTNIDITEIKRAEEEIRKLNEELEQRVAERTAALQATNKELEGFSYSVSHDLRAPLRAVAGFSRILQEEYKSSLDAEGQRLLDQVNQGATRMGRLIDDILAFSRMSRTKMGTQVVDMTAMARDVFADLQASAADRKIRFTLNALPPAMGDLAMLRQVWSNLLGNAVKYTAQREEAIIEVSGSFQGNELVYCVKDNGAGFDMQYANKLFGVFQRLHTDAQFEGTGIGLAIVRRVLERHSGRVWAEGKVNQGATFHFALPCPTK
jgi:PAS domain S-box-containing protein